MINHKKIIFIFSICCALFMSNSFAAAPSGAGPNQSTGIGPQTVTQKLYSCPSLASGSSYTTDDWNCDSMEDAGSCDYGDFVIGIFSTPHTTWMPPFVYYTCEWRCRNKYTVNCAWQ